MAVSDVIMGKRHDDNYRITLRETLVGNCSTDGALVDYYLVTMSPARGPLM